MDSQENSSATSSSDSSQNSDYLPPLFPRGVLLQNHNLCIRVIDGMNLAKLSIMDSPKASPKAPKASPIRSPLKSIVNTGGSSRSLLRRNTTTPEKIVSTTPKSLKRKCESNLDIDGGEGTPKSSKDPRMSSPGKRSPYLRAKRSPKTSAEENNRPRRGIAFTRQKITHEFDMTEGMADGVSETIADLFSKPIKSVPYASSPIVDEGYPKSCDWTQENSPASRGEITKRHRSIVEGENVGLRETKRARPSFETSGSRMQQKSVSLLEMNRQRDFSFPIPTSPRDISDRAVKSFRGLSNDKSEDVKIAVERIGSDSSLIGDGSKKYLLPVLPEEERKHQDLREISGDTLVKLLDGKFKETVDSFEIIDCRYPYEYHGGHIKTAINLYTERSIYEKFIMYLSDDEKERFKTQRHILIFHCEFSSQRGPSMCRYLRRTDRNANDYPFLFYPELYVLNGGYKDFFEKHQSFCDPVSYLPMAHSNYTEQYRLYKTQSKTDVLDTKNSKHKILPVKVKSYRQTSMKKLDLEEDEI